MTDAATLTAERLDEIERGCEGVPPGPWSATPQKGVVGHCMVAQVFDADDISMLDIDPRDEEMIASRLSSYFSRLDPQTVLALVAMARASLAQRAEPVADDVLLKAKLFFTIKTEAGSTPWEAFEATIKRYYAAPSPAPQVVEALDIADKLQGLFDSAGRLKFIPSKQFEILSECRAALASLGAR